MTAPIRTVVGCVAVFVGVCVLGFPATADTPNLPKDSYKRTADADLKFLQTRLGELAAKEVAGARLLEGQIKPALGVALMLSVYGDALGDEALHSGALKVAELIVKKDFKGAEALAKKLAVKPGTPGEPGALPKPFKDEVMLAAIKSPFRGAQVGGLNIDRDIKDMTKANMPTPIDPAAVEILAVRSAVISEFAIHSPDDRAKLSQTDLRLWDKWSKECVEKSKQIAEEAAKGDKADPKKLKILLTKLNARCTDCHGLCNGRDDDR